MTHIEIELSREHTVVQTRTVIITDEDLKKFFGGDLSNINGDELAVVIDSLQRSNSLRETSINKRKINSPTRMKITRDNESEINKASHLLAERLFDRGHSICDYYGKGSQYVSSEENAE